MDTTKIPTTRPIGFSEQGVKDLLNGDRELIGSRLS